MILKENIFQILVAAGLLGRLHGCGLGCRLGRGLRRGLGRAARGIQDGLAIAIDNLAMNMAFGPLQCPTEKFLI